MAQIAGNVAITRPQLPVAKKRANEISHSVIGQYKFQKSQLKPDMAINLVCYVEGMAFDVYRIGSNDHFFEISTQDADGSVHIITSPVERISFDIIISKKADDKPAREIGSCGNLLK